MNRHRPSRAAIAAALRHYEFMRVDGEPPGDSGDGRGAASGCEPEPRQKSQQESAQDTTRAAALEEFRRAKAAYHAAVLAVITGAPFAAERADDALRELNQARQELQRLRERGLC